MLKKSLWCLLNAVIWKVYCVKKLQHERVKSWFSVVGPTPAGDKKSSSQASPEKLSGEGGSSPTPHTLVSVPNKDEELDGRNSFSRLGRLAHRNGTPESGVGGAGLDSRASKTSSKKSMAVSQAGTHATNKPKSAASSGSIEF